MPARFDVVGIGNAIVDVFARTDDAFLEREGLVKGSMNLIDTARADTLYAAMAPATEVSGGSAANTIAGIASLGGRGAYIGKVTDDQLGQVFRHDIQAIGVHFETAPIDPASPGAPPTARSLILVTPDAHRTMNTFLGACVELGPDDIDEAVIAGALITYMEGYLWDRPSAKEAFLKAARVAHAAGRKVSLTLSDSFCVERHRDSFLDLIAGHIDVLFANETEIKALYRTDDLETAVAAVREVCEVVAVTRSEKGSAILANGSTIAVAAAPVEQVVDTTGAGDLYAAGFLYGLTQGLPLAECGRIAGIAAGEVISHVGARPEARLAELIAEPVPAE